MNAIPNPYVGPRAFEQGQIIYGRDLELRQIEGLLIAERIVLLHSPSGAGKTSLIQAGLIPRLMENEFRVLPVIRVYLEPPMGIRTESHFNRYVYSTIAALEEDLEPDLRLPPKEIFDLNLEDYLKRYPRLDDAPISEVLIFDQFEEILTSSTTDREAKHSFFEQLGEVLRNRDRWALFSIREDYVGAIAAFVRPIPSQFEITYRLDLLGPNAAKQAIQNPAHAMNFEFTDEAAQRLVDDLRVVQVQNLDGTIERQKGPYVEPVQLQVVCFQLWENHNFNKQIIDFDDIFAIGNVDQSLADYYSLIVANSVEKTGVDERLIREWFENRLITKEGIRGQVLLGTEYSEGLDNRAIRKLESAHIIRGEQRSGATWFELAHDRLIDPIRVENREWLAEHLSLFQQQAALWARQGKPEGMLLRGVELKNAEYEASTIHLNPDEEAFLQACRKLDAQEQREKRRNRLLTFFAIGAIIALILASIFWSRSNDTAKKNAQLAKDNANIAATAKVNEANAIDRLILAQTQLLDLREGKNAILKLALAIEAFRRLQDFESYRTLWSSVNQFMPETTYLDTGSSPIISICFSPDGKLLVSGSSDNRIQIWEVKTGTEQKVIKTDGALISVLCSSEEMKILSATTNGYISVWDMITGDKLAETINNEDIVSIALSADSTKIASGGRDGLIRLLDTRTVQLESVAQHDGSIESVEFSPDGEQIAAANPDGVVLLWDINSNEIKHLQTDSTELFIDYIPKASWLVTGGNDGRIIIWDGKTGEILETLRHNKRITALSSSPDGNLLITASDDDEIKVWDTNTFREVSEIKTYRAINSIEINSQDQYFVSGGFDGYTSIYKLGEVDRVGQIPVYIAGSIPNEGQVIVVRYNPDGRRIASASNNGMIIISSMVKEPIIHNSQIWDINFSNDDALLVTASRDDSAKIWDANTRREILRLIHSDWVNHAEFSPNGRLVATASLDNKAKIWRISDGQELFAIQHDDAVSTVKFSFDGAYIASAGWDGTAQIWQVDNATNVMNIQHGDRVNEVLFDMDHRWVITASDDHRVTATNLATREQAFSFSLDTAATSIALTPTGDLIIAGDQEGNIVAWDSQIRHETFSTNLNKSQIQKISISPDGNLLAAGNRQGDVCVWETDKWNEILCFTAEDAVWDIIFSSSDFILAASSDASVYIWDINTRRQYLQIILPGPVLSLDLSSDNHYLAMSTSAGIAFKTIWKKEDLVFEACKSLPRQLTPAEWDKYLGSFEYDPFCTRYPIERD